MGPTGFPLLPFTNRHLYCPYHQSFHHTTLRCSLSVPHLPLLQSKLLRKACLYSHILHEMLRDIQVTGLEHKLVPFSDAFFKNKTKVPNFSTARMMGSWQKDWKNDQAKGPGCESWLKGRFMSPAAGPCTAVSLPVGSKQICSLHTPSTPGCVLLWGKSPPWDNYHRRVASNFKLQLNCSCHRCSSPRAALMINI